MDLKVLVNDKLASDEASLSESTQFSNESMEF